MDRIIEDQDEMYQYIDHLVGQYSLSNYRDIKFLERERIGGFIYECNSGLDNYGGCRKNRITRYMIEKIEELLGQNKEVYTG